MSRPICDKLVMIVEDDSDVRESIAEILEDNAYCSLGCSNGKEALDELRARPDKPCVILLDIMMPVMDGLEFRALQQGDPDLDTIPVVVLTAHASVHASEMMAAAAWLNKPVQLETLLAMVERFC